MESEVWRDIPGYEGKYQASNLGEVRSLDRKGLRSMNRPRNFKGRILKHIFSPKGYHVVSLCGEGGKVSNRRVHRLVAFCFLKNKDPKKLTQINHKNGDKNDNRVTNLEWCDPTYNNHDALKNGLRTSGFTHWQSKPLEQVLNGEVVAIHGSLMCAYKSTGISFSSISLCANNKVKHAGGYQWRYMKKTGDLNSGL